MTLHYVDIRAARNAMSLTPREFEQVLQLGTLAAVSLGVEATALLLAPFGNVMDVLEKSRRYAAAVAAVRAAGGVY